MAPASFIIDKDTCGLDVVDLLPANLGDLDGLASLLNHELGKTTSLRPFRSLVDGKPHAGGARRQNESARYCALGKLLLDVGG